MGRLFYGCVGLIIRFEVVLQVKYLFGFCLVVSFLILLLFSNNKSWLKLKKNTQSLKLLCWQQRLKNLHKQSKGGLRPVMIG